MASNHPSHHQGNPGTPPPSLPPQQDEETSFSSSQDLIFRKEFEKSVKWFDDKIANTNYIMGVILAVLALGFVTLLTVIGLVLQAWGFNANIQSEMTKATKDQTEVLKELREEVHNLRKNNDSTESAKTA